MRNLPPVDREEAQLFPAKNSSAERPPLGGERESRTACGCAPPQPTAMFPVEAGKEDVKLGALNSRKLSMSAARPASHGTQELALQRGESRFSAWFAFVSPPEFERLATSPADFLSPQELAYFQQRKFPRRQQSYLLGRYAAKLALSQCLPEPSLKQIDIYPGVLNQPLVRHFSANTPGVSISHCADLAVALAFPIGHPMAVDIEPVDSTRGATIRSQLTPTELAWAGADPADEARQCALIWTAREALSKVLHCGLTTPPEILALGQLKPHRDRSWEISYANFAQYKCLSWITAHHALSIVLPRRTSLRSAGDMAARIKSFDP